jgi:hypothetical protein
MSKLPCELRPLSLETLVPPFIGTTPTDCYDSGKQNGSKGERQGTKAGSGWDSSPSPNCCEEEAVSQPNIGRYRFRRLQAALQNYVKGFAPRVTFLQQ